MGAGDPGVRVGVRANALPGAESEGDIPQRAHAAASVPRPAPHGSHRPHRAAPGQGSGAAARVHWGCGGSEGAPFLPWS